MDLDHYYPKLRVRNSWDFENQTSGKLVLAHSASINESVRSFDIETSQNSDGDSRSTSDENYFNLPGLEENFPHTDTSPQLSVSIPNFTETELYQEETKEQSGDTLEDLYREIQRTETEDSSTNRYVESNISDSSPNRYLNSNASSPLANTSTSVLTVVENGDGSNQELGSFQIKEDKGLDDFQMDFVIPTPEKTSEWGSACLKLTRSKSCKASLTTSLSSDWFQKGEKFQSTPPIVLEKVFTGRPGGLQKKLPALNYGAETEKLSRNGSQSSAGRDSADELKPLDIKPSIDDNGISSSTSDAGTKEKADLPNKKPLAGSEVSFHCICQTFLQLAKSLLSDGKAKIYEHTNSTFHVPF